VAPTKSRWESILDAYDCVLKHMRHCCNSYWRALEIADQVSLLTFLEATEPLKSSGQQSRDFNDTSLELIDILVIHRSRQSSDSRDKVYGFLGLCPAALNETLHVDYDASLADCYSLPVMYDLDQSRGLRTFGVAMLTGVERVDGGLPSWVPDWSTDANNFSKRANVFDSYGQYDAASGTKI